MCTKLNVKINALTFTGFTTGGRNINIFPYLEKTKTSIISLRRSYPDKCLILYLNWLLI